MKKEDAFYVAQIAFDSNLFDAAAKALKEIKWMSAPSIDELRFLSKIFKAQLTPLRSSIRKCINFYSEAPNKTPELKSAFQTYIESLKMKLKEICADNIKLYDSLKGSFKYSVEQKTLIKKTKTDFLRYSIDFDEDPSDDIMDIIEESYSQLLHETSSESNLEQYADTALCYSVFLHDIRKSNKEALTYARAAEHSVRELINSEDAPHLSISFENIYKLLKNNIAEWEM